MNRSPGSVCWPAKRLCTRASGLKTDPRHIIFAWLGWVNELLLYWILLTTNEIPMNAMLGSPLTSCKKTEPKSGTVNFYHSDYMDQYWKSRFATRELPYEKQKYCLFPIQGELRYIRGCEKPSPDCQSIEKLT
jgi:hypothetical protein